MFSGKLVLFTLISAMGIFQGGEAFAMGRGPDRHVITCSEEGNPDCRRFILEGKIAPGIEARLITSFSPRNMECMDSDPWSGPRLPTFSGVYPLKPGPDGRYKIEGFIGSDPTDCRFTFRQAFIMIKKAGVPVGMDVAIHFGPEEDKYTFTRDVALEGLRSLSCFERARSYDPEKPEFVCGANGDRDPVGHIIAPELLNGPQVVRHELDIDFRGSSPLKKRR